MRLTTRSRDLILQIVVVTLFVGSVVGFAGIAIYNVNAMGMANGWNFLAREAGFPLTSVWPFRNSTKSTYAEILIYGTANTLRLSAIVIVFSVALGIPIGAARIAGGVPGFLAGLYINLVRGPSLLLHVLFWYALTRSFSPIQTAFRKGGIVVFSNRGVFYPWLTDEAGQTFLLAATICFVVSAVLYWLQRAKFAERPSARMRFFAWALGVSTLLPCAIIFLRYGFQAAEFPTLAGFRVAGGASISPEFFAFTAAAIFYIANYVAEIVRQGVQSVDRGLSEASAALALRPFQTFLLIQLPLAMRNMLPPFTNLVTFIVKSTAAATAVGFSELFTVTSLSINHTGQVLELLTIMMLVYLIINSAITYLLNSLNDRLKVVTR